MEPPFKVRGKDLMNGLDVSSVYGLIEDENHLLVLVGFLQNAILCVSQFLIIKKMA